MGLAPKYKIGFTVAINVNEGTITSVVLFTPKIFKPKCIAEVPEFKATENFVLQNLESLYSKVFTVFDEVEIHSLFKTLLIDVMSFLSMWGIDNFILMYNFVIYYNTIYLILFENFIILRIFKNKSSQLRY